MIQEGLHISFKCFHLYREAKINYKLVIHNIQIHYMSMHNFCWCRSTTWKYFIFRLSPWLWLITHRKILHIKFTVYFHNKSHICNCNGSSVITITMKAKYIFHSTSFLLFYTIQKTSTHSLTVSYHIKCQDLTLRGILLLPLWKFAQPQTWEGIKMSLQYSISQWHDKEDSTHHTKFHVNSSTVGRRADPHTKWQYIIKHIFS
jgi:hypothetical protein